MLTIRQLKDTYNAEQIILVLLTRIFFNTATKADVNDFIANNKIDWTLLYKITRKKWLIHITFYLNLRIDI